MADTLLRASEVAKLLSISTKSVMALVHSGEIAFISIGLGKIRPRLRFELRDIEDFIRRNKRLNVQACPQVKTAIGKKDTAAISENSFQRLREERQKERNMRKVR